MQTAGRISLQETTLKLARLGAGGWTRFPEVPSSQNHSVTLLMNKHLIKSKSIAFF